MTKHLRPLTFLASVLVVGLPPAACVQTSERSVSAPVEVANSESFAMTSGVSGRAYQVFVAAPEGPAPESGYPVIYMTDANVRFLTMVETARSWARGRGEAAQNAIIVGIGYPDGVDAGRERSVDLTPALTDMATPEGFGGADDFLDFVLHELKPHIEATYPVDVTRQALFGHSFGGLFALYTLFNQPGNFQAYLISSPSIWWGERDILKLAPGLSPKLETSAAIVRVFVSVGELEQADGPRPSPPPDRPLLPGVATRTQVDDAKNIAAQFDEMPGVVSSFVLFDDEQHGTVPPAAMSRAVRFFFDSEDASQP